MEEMAKERDKLTKKNQHLETEKTRLDGVVANLKQENAAAINEYNKRVQQYNKLFDDYHNLDKDYDKLLTEYNGLVEKENKLIDRVNKASVDAEEAERVNSQLAEKKTLLEALNAQIDHARATAAAMGVGVSARLINSPKGWVLYAKVGNTSLPGREVSDEDAKAFKRGDMPAEILVGKYHPRAFQASPEQVDQYVKNHPKR
jgi:hypothetical protein